MIDRLPTRAQLEQLRDTNRGHIHLLPGRIADLQQEIEDRKRVDVLLEQQLADGVYAETLRLVR